MLRLVLALVLALFAFPSFAQINPKSPPTQTAPDVQVKRMGISGATEKVVGIVRVGERAPDFTLLAATGGNVRLKDTRGTRVALFFANRRDDLPEIVALAATLDSLQVRTIVVCNERVTTLAQWNTGAHASFPIASDDRGDIAAMYGLWDAAATSTRPGLFLLDEYGVVKLAVLGQHVRAPSLRGLVQTAVEGL